MGPLFGSCSFGYAINAELHLSTKIWGEMQRSAIPHSMLVGRHCLSHDQFIGRHCMFPSTLPIVFAPKDSRALYQRSEYLVQSMGLLRSIPLQI